MSSALSSSGSSPAELPRPPLVVEFAECEHHVDRQFAHGWCRDFASRYMKVVLAHGSLLPDSEQPLAPMNAVQAIAESAVVGRIGST
jgi:hypothetical protein